MNNYAAIIEKSIHHEGDERSRLNPGHGYPAHTEKFLEFKSFNSRDEMQRWVENQIKLNKTDYKIIEYNQLNVNVRVDVSIK